MLAWSHRIAAALVLAAAVIWGGLSAVEQQESRRSFCNACHLADGTPLHADKARFATKHPRLDLTGVHFSESSGATFSCATCHRGVGLRGRATVLWESLANTTRYAVGDYREPDVLAYPVVDAACTQCHADVTRPGDPSRFHGLTAHLDQSTIRCTDCHVAHAEAARPEAHARRLVQSARATCRRCHAGSPLAAHVRALLEGYGQTLLERMHGAP